MEPNSIEFKNITNFYAYQIILTLFLKHIGVHIICSMYELGF